MKKVLILTMFFLLVLAINVSAAGNLEFTNKQTSVVGNVGEQVVGSFKLNNTGTEDLIGIQLTATEFKGSTETFTIPSARITFQPGNYKSILNNTEEPLYNYTIAIPSTTFQDTYKGNISVKDSTNDHNDKFEVTLVVNPSSSLTGEDVSLTVVQGLQTEKNLTLTNSGNKDVNVAVDWTLGDGSSSDLGKDNILVQAPTTVEYAETDNALITVSAPADQAAGTYESTVTFTYEGKEFNQTLTINLQEKNEAVTLTSPSINWAKSGVSSSESAKLTIANTGNVDLSDICLSISDLTSGSNTISSTKVSFSSTSFNLAKSVDKEVTMTVSGLDSDVPVGEYTGTIKADWGTDNQTSTFKIVVRAPEKKLEFPSSVSLGSSTSKRNETYTTSFNVSNSGDYALSNLKVSSTSAAKYLVKFSLDGSNWETNLSLGTLAKGTDKTIHVQVYAPDSMDSGTVDVGNILFEADDSFTASISSFRLITKSYLTIEEARIYIDGDDETLDPDDIIDEVRPGSKIKIEFELKNNFDDNIDAEEDMDIDDIEVTVESKDKIGDDEVDETSDEIELEPDDDDTVTVEFDIDEEADEDTYEFTVTAEGEDKENSKHKVSWTFKLEVEKEDHQIEIAKAELSSSTLTCLRDTYLNILIRNLGQDDEDEVRVKVTSSDLNIAVDNRDIELSNDVGDDDNEYSLSIPVEVDEDFKSGTYKIVVETFYEDTDRSEKEEVILTVQDCSRRPDSGSSNDDDDEDDTGSIVIQTPTQGSTTTTTPTVPSTSAPPVTVTETTAASFRDSNVYIGLLIAAFAVVIVAIVMIAMKGFGPKYRY